MGKIAVCLAWFAVCGSAAAHQPVPGDSWVYRSASDSSATDTIHVVVEGLNTQGKPVFAGGAHFGLHSDTCLYDVMLGRELAGEVPCGKPLLIGQSWTATPKDYADGGQQWLTVTGTEEFTLGSRVFQATVIRVVAELHQLEHPSSVGHNFRRSRYSYVPELKGMVKIVHEVVDARGETVSHESFTLQDFHFALREK